MTDPNLKYHEIFRKESGVERLFFCERDALDAVIAAVREDATAWDQSREYWIQRGRQDAARDIRRQIEGARYRATMEWCARIAEGATDD